MISRIVKIKGAAIGLHGTFSSADSGKPLVLAFHGFTGTGRDFAPIFQGILQHVPWIGIDFLGHGFSDKPKEKAAYTLENVIGCIDGVVDLYKPSIILAYSMGGRLLLHYAKKFSSKVRAFVFVGTSPGIAEKEERNKREAQDKALAEKLRHMPMRYFIQMWQTQPLIATQAKYIPYEYYAAMLETRYACDPWGLANCLEAWSVGVLPSLWNELASVKTAVHLVAGEEDLRYQIAHEQMKTCLPNATLYTIPSAGHAAHLENLEAFRVYFKEIYEGSIK